MAALRVVFAIRHDGQVDQSAQAIRRRRPAPPSAYIEIRAAAAGQI